VNDIPFVNALGDEVQRAAAARIAARRGRIRRRLAIGGLGIAIAASGVAAAASGIFDASPEQLATTGIGCYSRADLRHSDVTVLSTGTASPVETCRRTLHADGPLVACGGPAVMVFPGSPGTCQKLGLKPLPAAYFAARRKVDRLATRIEAIEAKQDCWDPRSLARHVQALLDGLPAWRGWHTKLDTSMDEGPCGTVSHLQDDGTRSVDGVIGSATHTVLVMGVAARSTLDLLNGLERLPDESAERCYDRAGVEALARDRIAADGHPLTFRVGHLDSGSVDNLQARIDEGCSVIAGFDAAADGYGIVVMIRE
jgi:hypothetical protein